MDQTKHKPLRKRDFCKFSARNCSLHLEYIFLKKTVTRNKTLLFTSNIQILKFLKIKNKMYIVSKNLFRLLGMRCCG